MITVEMHGQSNKATRAKVFCFAFLRLQCFYATSHVDFTQHLLNNAKWWVEKEVFLLIFEGLMLKRGGNFPD